MFIFFFPFETCLKAKYECVVCPSRTFECCLIICTIKNAYFVISKIMHVFFLKYEIEIV